MTNKEILEKAVCKAKGYMYGCVLFSDIMENNNYYRIIFNKEFAKAFFGEETMEDYRGDFEDAWKFHLQQMVLEKEPIRYLERFL